MALFPQSFVDDLKAQTDIVSVINDVTPLKKAGACAIEIEDALQPGTGRLVWFLQPKMLRRWAARKEKV